MMMLLRGQLKECVYTIVYIEHVLVKNTDTSATRTLQVGTSISSGTNNRFIPSTKPYMAWWKNRFCWR